MFPPDGRGPPGGPPAQDARAAHATRRGHGDPAGPAAPRAGLYVHAGDDRPPSLLRPRPPSGLAIAGGFAAILVAYGSAAAAALVVALITAVQMADPDEVRAVAPDPPRQQVEFVEARLVKLGRAFDARELPNRIRRARTTAPDSLAEVPTKQQRRVRRPDAGVSPVDAVEDLLARIGTSADRHAAIAAAAAQEGDPEGVAEGTATREQGDLYATRLYAFFRRGFNMPAEITDAERRGLRSTVQVTTGPDGRIESFSASPSGNAAFDLAVRQRLEQAVGSYLPPPPDDERERYFGATFPIGMRPPR